MRILMLSWEYPPRIVGGISRVVYHLATELGRQGQEVTVITVNEGDMPEKEIFGKVTVYRVMPYMVEPLNFIDSILQMNLAMINKAAQLLHEGHRFDIMHLHDWLVAYAGKVIKSAFPSITCVSTFHATEAGRNFGIHNDMQSYISNVEKVLSEMSEKIIVNSGFMKGEIKRLFNVADEHIFIIPNGVDIRKFRGIPCDLELRGRYAKPNEKVVLFVGRLVKEKGVFVLLEAIPKVLSRFPDVKFIIAGKGPEQESLEKRAGELNVSASVIFPGFISDEVLLKLYRCSDLAVFPSLYEPFGIVALEGMVAHVPIVVSDTGGLNQIIEHKINGMKFETGNSEQLADCIHEVLTDSLLASNLVKQAAKSVNLYYRWDDIAARTYIIYKQAMGSSI